MIDINDLSYSVEQFSLKNITFSIDKGDYFALVGPSGAGKTIIIELLAGFIKPLSGSISLNNIDITHAPIQERPFAVVFQDYALFPHLTSFQNIEFGLKSKIKNKIERRQIIENIAHELNIAHLLTRYPDTLSGGEQQRIAIARALVCEPALLIFDEPLSAIDDSAKDELINILKKLNSRGVTIVHITHDYEEALNLSNKIAFIYQGKLIQQGLTSEVLCNPKHPFIARFVGHKNIFKANFVQSEENRTQAQLENSNITVNYKENYSGNGFVYITSDDILLSKNEVSQPFENHFIAQITEIHNHHNKTAITVNIGVSIQCTIAKHAFETSNFTIGDTVHIYFESSAVWVIPAN